MQNIAKLDSQNMLGSIHVLNKQCEDAWQAMKKVKIPKNYKDINKIVLFGMGGSLLGIEVIKNLFADQIKVPILIVNDYKIPAYVDNKTLAIMSSYSGSTEETVTASKNILKKTKKVFVVTTGKDLASFAKRNKLPVYLIDPQYNPCGQPRMAVGYSIVGQLALFKKLGLVKINDKDIEKLSVFLSKSKKRLENLAIKHAKQLKNKVPVYVASEFLLGNVHVVSNQTNENGKNMSARFEIPELNHHLMEGLGYPKTNKQNLYFVLINSDLYHKRNIKRYKITKTVIAKNKVKFVEIKARAKNKFLQSFEVLAWGSYLSFYLSMINNIDPSPIPWVDYFKDELSK